MLFIVCFIELIYSAGHIVLTFLALFISFKRNNRANVMALFSKVRPSVLRPGVNVMNINNRDLGLERDILIQTEKEDKPVKGELQVGAVVFSL